jgi:hypothetical protein
MNYLIIKKFKDKDKIQGLILLDIFTNSYYLYDFKESLVKKHETIKNSFNDESFLFNEFLEYPGKFLIPNDIFRKIINLKIKKIFFYSYNDFLNDFELIEWMI